MMRAIFCCLFAILVSICSADITIDLFDFDYRIMIKANAANHMRFNSWGYGHPKIQNKKWLGWKEISYFFNKVFPPETEEPDHESPENVSFPWEQFDFDFNFDGLFD